MHYLKNICLELISMIWDIYWGLAFGFMLSSVIRAFVPASAVSSRLGDNTVKSLGMATFFGAISSSCSYAAVSMARTLLVKGATWPNAVAFMVASTNLVFEIFIVIVSVLGWSFFGGEIIGGVLFIVISAWLIARFYPARIAQDAKDHLVRQNKQHGDGDMHMAGHEQSGLQQKDVKEPETPKGFGDKLKLASGHFYMDVMMVGKDILVGVVAASVIMAVVPAGFWNALFLTNNHVLPHFLIVLWDIVIGVLVAIFSFVCSVGNIVMGAALWHGGISFGGVIAYILADLVTIPMLAVYKDYFGKKSMFALLALLSLSIVIAALSVDLGFHLLGWIPQTHGKQPMEMAHTFEWNYKTLLNLFFIPVSVIYFFYGKKQSGMKM